MIAWCIEPQVSSYDEPRGQGHLRIPPGTFEATSLPRDNGNTCQWDERMHFLHNSTAQIWRKGILRVKIHASALLLPYKRPP
eukprot:5202104-Amphidinium_carterae.1